MLLESIGEKLMKASGRMYLRSVFLFCLLFLQGCLLPRLHPIVIEENPADWIRDLATMNPTWRLITSKSGNGGLKGPDIISVSLYGRGDWFVKTGSGVDVWVYKAAATERSLLSGALAREKIHGVNDKKDSILSSKASDTREVLQITDNPSSHHRSFVVLDLERIFSDHTWCRMVWLDDGIKGMCYVRGEPYRREKRIQDSLVGATAVNIAKYRQVEIEAPDYDTLSRLIVKHRQK